MVAGQFSHVSRSAAPFMLVALWLWPQSACAQFAAFALSQPQLELGQVLDQICGVSTSGDLQDQCDGFLGVLGNGGEALTLQQLAGEEYGAAGNLAVEFSSRQRNATQGRLRSLRQSDDASGDARATFSLGGIGAFVSPSGSIGDHDGSSREDPFEAHSVGVLVGLDTWLGERAIFGIAFLYEHRDLNFDSVGRVSNGKIDIDAYGGSLYGSVDADLVQLDAVLSFTYSELDQERRLVSQVPGYPLNRSARSDTDSQTYAASLEASRGVSWHMLEITPFAEISHQFLHVDGFKERGANGLNFRVDAQEVHSLQSALGLRFAYPVSTRFGVVQPHLRAAWRHEYLDDDREIDARFLADSAATEISPKSDDPDRDYATLGAGLSITLPRGFQPYVDYQAAVGLIDATHHVVRAGLRMEF